LLLSCATPADIQQLAVEARDAELEEQDYEKAKALWWQVIEADRSTQNDRAKARKAIDRINHAIHQKTHAYQQRQAEEKRKKAAEHQLESQQELDQQQQERLKQEAAVQQRQAEEQERQRREPEELKRQQAEAERLNKEELARANELASEKGIDYAKLRDLLQASKWQDADQETKDRMCEVMGRQKEGWLQDSDVQNFPCIDLCTIDQLWVKHSQGQFGFSVQKKNWQECGSPTSYNTNWENFGEAVGWRKKGFLGMNSDWKSLVDITFDNSSAPKGHLPWVWSGVVQGLKRGSSISEGRVRFVCNLFSRVNTCKL
jgi:GUN4-like